MAESLPTLRKHEAALRGLRRSQPSHHTHDPFVDALDYALTRLREDIARAEADFAGAMPCASCHGEEMHFDQCGACGGHGTRNGKPVPEWVAREWRRGTGKRPTEVT
jgi:hypothetical protein